MASPAEVAINPFLYAQMPFDPAKDLVAVAKVASASLVFIGHDQSFEEQLSAQGAGSAPLSPGEFAAFVQGERDKYARLVKASGAKVD